MARDETESPPDARPPTMVESRSRSAPRRSGAAESALGFALDLLLYADVLVWLAAVAVAVWGGAQRHPLAAALGALAALGTTVWLVAQRRRHRAEREAWRQAWRARRRPKPVEDPGGE